MQVLDVKTYKIERIVIDEEFSALVGEENSPLHKSFFERAREFFK